MVCGPLRRSIETGRRWRHTDSQLEGETSTNRIPSSTQRRSGAFSCCVGSTARVQSPGRVPSETQRLGNPLETLVLRHLSSLPLSGAGDCPSPHWPLHSVGSPTPGDVRLLSALWYLLRVYPRGPGQPRFPHLPSLVWSPLRVPCESLSSPQGSPEPWSPHIWTLLGIRGWDTGRLLTVVHCDRPSKT